MFYNFIGSIKNYICRPVILFKFNNACILKIVFKIKNILYISTSPAINTLVIITNNAKIMMLSWQQFYKLILWRICILILVYHYILKTVLILFKNFRTLSKKLNCHKNKVIKIKSIIFYQLILIFCVYSGISFLEKVTINSIISIFLCWNKIILTVTYFT